MKQDGMQKNIRDPGRDIQKILNFFNIEEPKKEAQFQANYFCFTQISINPILL